MSAWPCRGKQRKGLMPWQPEDLAEKERLKHKVDTLKSQMHRVSPRPLPTSSHPHASWLCVDPATVQAWCQPCPLHICQKRATKKKVHMDKFHNENNQQLVWHPKTAPDGLMDLKLARDGEEALKQQA